MRGRERALLAAQVASLVTCAGVACLVSETRDWEPLGLFVLLLVLALASELFRLRIRALYISASFLAIVLAMTLLGPTPAVVIGISVMLGNVAVRRTNWRATVANLSTYSIFPLVGGVAFEAIDGPSLYTTDEPAFVVLVVVVFLTTNFLNFMLAALHAAVVQGQPIRRAVMSTYVPVLWAELAVAILTAGAAVVYLEWGLATIGVLAGVGVVFHYLLSLTLAASDRKERDTALVAGQAAALVGSVAVAALLSTSEEWESGTLFALLLTLACVSELFRLRTKRFFISASFLAIVLGMTLMGPAPAVLIGISVMLVNVATRRTGWRATLNNLSTYAVFPLVGGAVFEALDGPMLHNTDKAGYVALIVAVFLATNLLNFLLIALDIAVVEDQPIHRNLLSIYLPVLPVEVAVATLTAGAALIYQEQGLVAIGVLTVVASLFQYLLSTALAAMDRKEQLEGRTRQLASLQVGLITTVLQTLSLRDKHTARHSAAVARFSREVARAIGLSEREQEIVHTAGLLHDIGKFIFPDSILLADTELTHQDWAIVRRHPEQGAQLVRRIEGYGPVADLILAHHERMDGRGYPRGLRGEDIPLGSRIISVADTYDVLTARDSYRDPVSPEDAIAELRKMAGTQLDARLVDVFVELVRDRSLKFRHGDDADFERELNFERRVQDYAEPRAVVA